MAKRNKLGLDKDAMSKEAKLMISQSEVVGSQVISQGEDVLPPVCSFAEMSLTDRILKVLQRIKIFEPSAVQVRGIPIILSGKHVVVGAFPGAGKTLMYVLPLLVVMDRMKAIPRSERGPVGVIVCPNRESVRQTFGVFCTFKTYEIRMAAAAGGDDISWIKRRGVDILISTPAKLVQLAEKCVIGLQNCSYMVIEEADTLLSVEFERDMRMLMGLVSKPQIVLVSSIPVRNIGCLDKTGINWFARQFLRNFETLNVGLPYSHIGVEQKFCFVPVSEMKIKAVLKLLPKTRPPILIVCTHKSDVEDVWKKLSEDAWKKEYSAVRIHSGIETSERDRAITDFRSRKVRVLVGVASILKGLYFNKRVKHVISYEMPGDLDVYLRRVFAASDGALSTTLLDSSCSKTILAQVKTIIEESGKEVPPELTNLINDGKEGDILRGVKNSTAYIDF